MTDTCSPMSPQPLAFYDPDSSCWRTSQGTSLWGEPTLLERLPDWGMTRGGELFERPTPVRLTVARDCSSSQLPTPNTSDAHGAKSPEKIAEQRARQPGGYTQLREVAQLLPTPHANASTGPGQQGRDGGANLQTAVTLLPTPQAMDGAGAMTPAVNDMGRGKTAEQWDEWTAKMQASHANGNGHGKSLEIEAQRLAEGE